MLQPIFDYFEQKSTLTLTDEEREKIRSRFKFKKLLKKQYLLQEGDLCKYMGFILKGAARMYSIDDRGHEHIMRFGMEGWWIGDYESYMLQTPTKFHIEMLEDTEMLIVTREHIQELTK